MKLYINVKNDEQLQCLIRIIRKLYHGDTKTNTEQATATVFTIAKSLGLAPYFVTAVVQGDGKLKSLPARIRPLSPEEPNSTINKRWYNKFHFDLLTQKAFEAAST